MKSLIFPKHLQEEASADTPSPAQPAYPVGRRTSPPDSSMSFAQFNRLLADYRRAGRELAAYWQQAASQQ